MVRAMVQIPGAYHVLLLPTIFAHARPSPFTSTDVLLLRKACSVALQRGDVLQLTQVEEIIQVCH